jgi:hypothetical protein
MRDAPNFEDANLALRLYELRREPEMRKARALVGSLAGKPWEEVEPILGYGHPENAHFRQATSYWEMVAAFVNRGIFHPDTYLDACGEGIFTYWTFRPHVERIRATGRPRFLLQTERLVADHAEARERLDLIDRSMAVQLSAEGPRPAIPGAPRPSGAKKAGKAPARKKGGAARRR